MPVNQPSTSAIAKRKVEYHSCLVQAGDGLHTLAASSIWSFQWSFLLHHLMTATLTGHCQHNMPIGVYLLRLGHTCWNIKGQWCSIFFRELLTVPERGGASVGGKQDSREEPPDYKSDHSQEAMLNPRSNWSRRRKTQFKPVKLHLKIDLMSHPAHAEG